MSPAWSYSAVAQRILDTNEAVWFDGYTQIPANGTAEVSFSGSGIAVWFVIPKGPGGTLRFDLLTYTFDGQITETLYDQKVFSSHGHEIKRHDLKVISEGIVAAVDTAIYNPGPPSDDDPDDD